MIYFEDIKLIIWDLDDTFWKGTLSERDIQPYFQNNDLVKNELVRESYQQFARNKRR